MGWRLARSLEQLRSEVQARWPGTTVWTIGDAAHRRRASDHNPNQAGVVCAIDIVGRNQAEVLWTHLLATRDPRIKYVIFDRKIVSRMVSPWVVRRYSGSNPHTDHVHVSVGVGRDGRSTGPYDDPSPWGLATAPAPAPPVAPPAPDIRPTRSQIVALPLLKRGANGQYVRNLQGLLIAHGNDLRVDGDFGPVTERTLTAWQGRTRRLAADGICGPNTWTWLTGVS